MSRSRPLDRHHIKPRSRFEEGEDVDKDNIAYWDSRWHQRWHAMFSNLTPQEVIQLLTEMSEPDSYWDNKHIHRRMLEIKGEK